MSDNITLTGKIVEKKLILQQRLQNTIAAHNETVNRKDDLFSQIQQLRGALQILEELDNDQDTSSDTEST